MGAAAKLLARIRRRVLRGSGGAVEVRRRSRGPGPCWFCSGADELARQLGYACRAHEHRLQDPLVRSR